MKDEKCISLDKFELKPGAAHEVVGEYPHEKIDKVADLNDLVRIYVKCHTDKSYYDKAECLYSNFLHNYSKESKSIENMQESVASRYNSSSRIIL